ncbi:uncharacterized protein LOC107209913 [Parus major]|uniref:uncharacterized protein LOC107209913 n=1 Tax=Parus major TaxID=9157 RepID=UPI00077112B8|nr:uncharacterized protein LOC107209913 [Parus major]XP_033373061.1 uncharacterized protein LOC107209913 [Parus major]XP_033373062.1 uncharacterized protein LOC107209913 [Parus major]
MVAPARSPFSSWKPAAPGRARQGQFPAWATPGPASHRRVLGGERALRGRPSRGNWTRVPFEALSRTGRWVWRPAPLSGLRGAGDRKGTGFVRQPCHGRYMWKPDKLVWKRRFPRSQRRQGFVHGRAAAPAAPPAAARLRGNAAAERGEQSPARGQRGCSPSSASGTAAPGSEPLPASFLRAGDGDRRELESPGWSRAESCNRIHCKAHPEMEDLYSFLLLRKICQVSKWFD